MAKFYKIMRDWYKPTKRGERARELLERELSVDNDTGAVGEKVNKPKRTPKGS